MADILIVEDNVKIAANIKTAVERSNIHRAQVALNVSEALSSLERGAFHLILLDVGLPDGSGFSLLKQLRLESSIPVIFLTAQSEEIDRVMGLELGADDYIAKPFSPRELLARVNTVLKRSGFNTAGAQASPGVVSKHKFFIINDVKKEALFLGQLLELSYYEYAILSLLLKNPGQVYSRDQIMGRVWKDPLMSHDRSVDSHVKNLRAKLEEVQVGASEWIQTKRSIGYFLKET